MYIKLKNVSNHVDYKNGDVIKMAKTRDCNVIVLKHNMTTNRKMPEGRMMSSKENYFEYVDINDYPELRL